MGETGGSVSRHFTLPGGDAAKTGAGKGHAASALCDSGNGCGVCPDKLTMKALLALPAFCLVLAALLSAPVAAAQMAWLGMTEISAGRGERGPWQQNDSRYDYVDDPAVAIDDAGEISIAWVDQGRKDVFFQRISPEGVKRLAQPVNIARSPATFSWLPRVVIAPDDPKTIFVLWQEIIFAGGAHGGDILFARSGDGGSTFTPPVNLTNSVGGDGKGRINKDIWHNGSLDIVAGRDGAVYAAWTEYDGLLWFVRSTDGGRTFSRPQHLAGGGDAKPVRGPALAIGPRRSIYLAWTTGEDDAADIHLMQSTDGGTQFSKPSVVARTATYSDAPKLVVDRTGAIHLVHAESSGGPFEPYRILYSRSDDGGRAFSAPRVLARPDGDAGASFPSIALDERGRLLVLWERYQSGQRRPRGLALTLSDDGGRSFTAPEVVPESTDPAGGTNGSHQGMLMKKLAMNGAGAVAIVNSSLKQNDRSRVWLTRGRLLR